MQLGGEWKINRSGDEGRWGVRLQQGNGCDGPGKPCWDFLFPPEGNGRATEKFMLILSYLKIFNEMNICFSF